MLGTQQAPRRPRHRTPPRPNRPRPVSARLERGREYTVGTRVGARVGGWGGRVAGAHVVEDAKLPGGQHADHHAARAQSLRRETQVPGLPRDVQQARRRPARPAGACRSAAMSPHAGSRRARRPRSGAGPRRSRARLRRAPCLLIFERSVSAGCEMTAAHTPASTPAHTAQGF